MTPMLIAFSLIAASIPWDTVDDVVMGGASAGSAHTMPEGHLRFSGVVSLANNGGFSSIRSTPARHDLVGASAIVVRVRGDGKRYKFNLRTDMTFDGVQYQAPFDTRAGEWQDITLPLSAFEPRWRGRLVPDAPALDPGRIVSFGFLIADRQAGPFALDVHSIRAQPASPP
ncbi:MAG: CIA30 family protein [Betaproteobacteria bacterium]|jgi:monofunctional biosynthetic peptidoglycan transglycosylase